MHIVAPSQWLANCVQKSVMMRGWPVTRSNAIDTEVWRPIDKGLARRILGLPDDKLLLLFGSMYGTRDSRKGFDLLTSALEHLRGNMPGLELIILGGLAPTPQISASKSTTLENSTTISAYACSIARRMRWWFPRARTIYLILA